MGCPQDSQSIEFIIEEADGGVALTAVNNCDKLLSNNNHRLVLDFDKLFGNGTGAAIDPRAIVSLNLSRSNLNYFPDGFAGLELKRLDLSHNKLQHVPNCILNGLRSLEALDLSHNVLQSFEDEPKCVKNLRQLKISNNRLANIPEWILRVDAFNLEELDFSYNQITSLKKSQFLKKASYELAKLELNNCLIRTQDIKYLKQIRTLISLDLSNTGQNSRNCFDSCDSFSTLFDKPLWDDRLKVLHLNDLQISFIPEEISQLTALEEFSASGNDLMWLPDSLTSIDKLRVLDLSYNQIACLPNNMCNLKHLEVLRAPHNCISRVQDLSSISLKILDLYDNYLDTDCDIKIDSTILQVDLEQNFFNSGSLDHQGYEEKKCLLRSDVLYTRKDGSKEQDYDDVSSDISRRYGGESSSDCDDDGACRDELVEESWSLDYKFKSSDNGVTSSDNEWTGCETVQVIRKKRKPKPVSCPSWMYEDAEG